MAWDPDGSPGDPLCQGNRDSAAPPRKWSACSTERTPAIPPVPPTSSTTFTGTAGLAQGPTRVRRKLFVPRQGVLEWISVLLCSVLSGSTGKVGSGKAGAAFLGAVFPLGVDTSVHPSSSSADLHWVGREAVKGKDWEH